MFQIQVKTVTSYRILATWSLVCFQTDKTALIAYYYRAVTFASFLRHQVSVLYLIFLCFRLVRYLAEAVGRQITVLIFPISSLFDFLIRVKRYSYPHWQVQSSPCNLWNFSSRLFCQSRVYHWQQPGKQPSWHFSAAFILVVCASSRH